jgi:hypothetical protein
MTLLVCAQARCLLCWFLYYAAAWTMTMAVSVMLHEAHADQFASLQSVMHVMLSKIRGRVEQRPYVL